MRVALFIEEDSAISEGAATTMSALVGHMPGDVDVLTYRLEPGLTCVLRVEGILRRARRDRVDLIHLASSGPAAIAALFVARQLNVPVVGSFSADFASTLVRRRYLRLLSQQSERVFAPSMSARGRLVATGLNPATITIWRPGVDATMFSPSRRSTALRERWHVSDERPAVLYVGALSGEKGVSRLLSLEIGLHRTHPMHRLIVIGDGPDRALLENKCPDAVFMGTLPHSDIPAVMASADLFVCPSVTCSTNHAVLEAQAAGLPAAVMDEGSARERVSESSAIVCRSNVDLIVETASLIRTAARRKVMSAAARENALRQRWSAGLAPVYAEYRSAGQLSGARRDFRPALAPQSRRL